MHKRIWIVIAALAFCVAADARAARHRIDFDPEAPFGSYRTFRLVDLADAPPSATGVISNPDLRAGVEHRLRVGLEGQGLREAAEGEEADLVVRWWTGLDEAFEVGRVGGYAIFLEGGWSSIHDTIVRENVGRGIFLVDLIDAASEELAWRAYIPVDIDDPIETRKRFYQQIGKALDRFPPSERQIRRLRKERAARAAD